MSNNDTTPPTYNLKEKTAKGLFWGGISNAVQQGISLVFGIVLARILNPDDYGLIAMLAIFSAVASTVIDSGFAVALINKKDVSHEDYNSVFWFSLFLGIFLYLILFFCAPLISLFFTQPALNNLSRFIFLGFVFGSLGIVHNVILLKELKVKQIGIVNILASAISGIIGLLTALNGFGYWALAMQQVTFILFTSVLRWYFSPWKPTFAFSLTPIKEMFNFSSKLFCTNVLVQVQWNMFNVLLGKFYNKTLLGYFSQGTKWMNMVNQIVSGVINPILQPVFVHSVDNPVRQLRIFRKMTRFISFVIFPVFIGLAFVAHEFIIITIGEKWLDSVIYLQIMCVWACVMIFYLLFTQLLVAYGKSSIIFKGNIYVNGLQILVIIIMLLLNFSVEEVLVSYIAILCLSIVYWYYYVNKQIRLKVIYLIKDVLPYFAVTMIAILLSFSIVKFMNNIYIIFTGKIIITAAIYFVALYILESKILKDAIYLLKYKSVELKEEID
jgi:O-antigen/teichoic acid export membrane protein